MEALLLGLGLGLVFSLAPVTGWRRIQLLLPRKSRCLAVVFAIGMSTLAGCASHATIWPFDDYYASVPLNAYRVYLSSPRHATSGSRGECGWEENINGRHWNYYSAAVDTGGYGGFLQRHYATVVSGNARDDGWRANREAGNNWGAHIYIVTHTNAPFSGCHQPPQYLLVMHQRWNANSTALRDQLLAKLDQSIPGGESTWWCNQTSPPPNQVAGECTTMNLAPYPAYVELFFHTNQDAVNWFQAGGGPGTGVNNSWRVGQAVDHMLGYPR